MSLPLSTDFPEGESGEMEECKPLNPDDIPTYSDLMQKINEATKGMKNRKERVGKEKTAFCEICNAGFVRRNEMRRHMRHVHKIVNDQTYKVPKKATFVFPDDDGDGVEGGEVEMDIDQILSKLAETTGVITPPPPQDGQKQKTSFCPICKSGFVRSNEMRRHFRNLHCDQMVSCTARGIECTTCNKMFLTPHNLQMHIQKHERDPTRSHRPKIVRCPVDRCQATFTRKCNLPRHMEQIHGEIRKQKEIRFPCTICGQGFYSKSSLRVHRNKIHEIARKYKKREENEPEKEMKCAEEGCSERFVSHLTMARHAKKRHGKEDGDLLVCHVGDCEEKFTNSSALSRHTRMKHGREIRQQKEKVCFCSRCDKGFTRMYQLKRHWHDIHGEVKTSQDILDEQYTPDLSIENIFQESSSCSSRSSSEAPSPTPSGDQMNGVQVIIGEEKELTADMIPSTTIGKEQEALYEEFDELINELRGQVYTEQDANVIRESIDLLKSHLKTGAERAQVVRQDKDIVAEDEGSDSEETCSEDERAEES